jgi:2,3-bisphosphoglycerate-dependent phosphoglycerate mutase/probable phosphoglycerate mutase
VHDLLIIRHGESEWNLEGRWQGWHDAPLTDLGLAQARERAAALVESGFSPKCVYSSDLGRARQTAEIMGDALNVPVKLDAGFRERSGGDWEAHTIPEIDEKWPGMREKWRSGELATPPNGELDTDVIARFDAALASAIAEGTPTMVVTHGGSLRLVATQAGVSITALTPNLGGYWFTLDGTTLTNAEPVAPLASATTLPDAE